MPFYEIAYETGRMSVAEYANDDEAKMALKAHNDRAVSGLAGGPIGQPAERIAAVYVYANHPDSFNEMQAMSADVLQKEVAALIKSLADENGVVAIDQLAVEVRGLSHPMKERKEPFGSMFKLKESKSLKLAFLAGEDA
jgi:hypothetical protein